VTRSVARTISIIGHPFLLIPLAIGYAVSRELPEHQAVRIMGVLFAWMLLFGAYVVVQVRRGVWTDVDVSKREHRPRMYLVVVGLGLPGIIALWWGDYPSAVLIGMGSAVALLVASAIINRWIKVSLHAAFSVYAVFVIVSIDGIAAAALLAIPLLIAWSRVAMGRHTRNEVLLGLAFGTVASVPLLG
jgi:hypothetical protein